MPFVHELALFVLIATPVAVIAAMNAMAMMAGEHGTLMLPDSGAMKA